MKKTLFAFVAAMAAFVALAVPGHAVDVVVPDLDSSRPAPEVVACEPPDPTNPAVSGSGDWNPPVTTLTTAHGVAMYLSARCDQGAARLRGTWRFGMVGTSSEDCAAGTGTFGRGNVWGTGPNNVGDYRGHGTFKKVGIHYYIDLDVRAGDGKEYHADLWVDVDAVFHQGEYCFYDSAHLFGHGAVRRTK